MAACKASIWEHIHVRYFGPGPLIASASAQRSADTDIRLTVAGRRRGLLVRDSAEVLHLHIALVARVRTHVYLTVRSPVSCKQRPQKAFRKDSASLRQGTAWAH